MPADDAYERVHAETADEWRAWLEANHALAPGAWLVSWKAATGRPAVGYARGVEEALCFGWVDSVQRTLDDERSMLRYTPRRPASRWSRSNRERVERLIADGRMTEAGLAVVEEAKRSGAWTALEEVERLIVPDDLAAAFGQRPGSRERWDAFPPGARRAILTWILDAKRPETRARRVAETASEAERGRRAHE